MRYLLVVLGLLLTGCMVPVFDNGVYHNRYGAVIRWQPEDFPLEIVVDEELSPDRQQALQSAILTWNRTIGANVFTITRELNIFSWEAASPARGTLIVLEADLPDNTPGEYTQGFARLFWEEASMQTVYVMIDVAVVEAEAEVVFVHELGHALGLRHDDSYMSVMYRSAINSWRRIENDDIAFIRWEMQSGN